MSSSKRKDGSFSLSEQDFEQIVNKAVDAAMTVIRRELNEGRGYCYDTATCQTLLTVSRRGQVMLSNAEYNPNTNPNPNHNRNIYTVTYV